MIGNTFAMLVPAVVHVWEQAARVGINGHAYLLGPLLCPDVRASVHPGDGPRV